VEDLIARAQHYATSAHARINHLRKYSLQPYDVHLLAVAKLVATVTDDQEMIAAAWLHDVVEDTSATFDDLEREFGSDITALVRDLTDVSKPGDGNRAIRKAMDREHTALGSPGAKTIKLADIIDNCTDICRHDPKFGRVFLTEAQSLMEVLQEGDATLYARASATIATCTRKIGRAPAKGTPTLQTPLPIHSNLASTHGIRLFAEAFTARDIQEPLLSFDSGTIPTLSATGALPSAVPLVGIRRNGLISGYIPIGNDTRLAVDSVRAIDHQQVVSLETAMPDVIHVLTHFDFCFVAVDGAIFGVIGKRDIEKPVVRMWLFGIIILMEMLIVETIKTVWPQESWVPLVSEGRLDKAKQLQTERLRRGMNAELLDCLQFSDKFQVALNNPQFMEVSGIPSVSAAKKTLKELESLRNNLAHGQDITKHDWPQIVRLAHRIQNFFGT